MTETYDSEILNCLKINEALRGGLSSFMPLACKLKSLQKGPLSEVWKVRPQRENQPSTERWSGIQVRERWLQGQLSWGSFFPQAEGPRASDALSRDLIFAPVK